MENSDRIACILSPMSNLGQRIKDVREERNLTLQQLAAKAGIGAYQTIQDLESGKSKGSKYLLAIAKALAVNPEWLDRGTGRREISSSDLVNHPPNDHSGQTVRIVHSEPRGGDDRIKVMGMAECGPDGWALFNGDVVDRVPRPANLSDAKDAYAVFITGDSMEPRYFAGEIAFIHPGKPVSPRAFVLVQRKPKADGDTPMAVIKQLVKRSGDKVILGQLNPEKQITVPASDIISMHRVVGSGEP